MQIWKVHFFHNDPIIACEDEIVYYNENMYRDPNKGAILWFFQFFSFHQNNRVFYCEEFIARIAEILNVSLTQVQERGRYIETKIDKSKIDTLNQEKHVEEKISWIRVR